MPCGRTVLQDSNEQLTATMRTNLLTAALVFSTATVQPGSAASALGLQGPKRPLSSSNYLAYKKAQLISASDPTVRPPQSSIVTDLQKLNNPT
jgi:hypothetical protein